jgi:hypothetical protein
MPDRFPPPWSIEDDAACFIVRDQRQAGAGVSRYRERARPVIECAAEVAGFKTRQQLMRAR